MMVCMVCMAYMACIMPPWVPPRVAPRADHLHHMFVQARAYPAPSMPICMLDKHDRANT